MKKLYLLVLVFVLGLFLVGCNSSEYQIDGKFTAYEVSVHSNAPQVTYVTVTVSDGEIVDYNIDVRQGSQTMTEGETTTYSYSWDEMTKKEKEDAYGMKLYGTKLELVDGEWVEVEGETSEYEWYEQAQFIEDYLLENGIEAVETVDERFSNIAGVTIKEAGFLDLAAEAVELAKSGTFQSLLCVDDDLYTAKMVQDTDGEIVSLMLDVLKGAPDGETFAWSEQTKQELGDDYGMKGVGAAYEFSDGEWVATDGKTSLEWYEQANLITDYIIANGWNENLAALAGRGATIDGTTLIDDLAGATIRTQTYFDVLSDLFNKVG